MPKEINVGLIGCGFMGRAHSNAYKDVSMFFDLDGVPVMKAICGIPESAVKAAAENFGWEGYDTSWQNVVKRDDIHLIDVATPGNIHRDIVIGAAEAGKNVLCEKPLANSLAEAKEMLDAVQKAGVKHMVAFNYRRVPAVALAKQIIDEGRIGDIYHWRAVYLQDWIVDPNFPLVWRLQKDKAGSGPHGDLNAHIIDLAHYLLGDITEVVAMEKTFIKKRPLQALEETKGLEAAASKEMGEVTVEDAMLFLAKFGNGALGSFEATRFASGRRNYNSFEINGSKGSIAFNLERLNELQYYSSEDERHVQGFRTILVNEDVHPYMAAWWPAGHIIGWEHTFIHEIADLMNAIARDEMPVPSFEDGVKCQTVLETVSKSAEEGCWIKVSEI